jgi:putative membrane protein
VSPAGGAGEPPLSGTWQEARFPLVLLGALLLVCAVTVSHSPAGATSWFLEVTPGLLYVAVLTALFPRFPMTRWVYVGLFLHVCILIYGGMYTYALAPLGSWAKEAFHLSRNHYDRVGHLALGFFPAFTIREVLLRQTPLRRGGWLTFLVLCVVLAIGAFWELLEWWSTLVLAPDTGAAFLGSQGDVWDAQWDMFLALVGAAIALSFFSRSHDRALARLFSRCPPRGSR